MNDERSEEEQEQEQKEVCRRSESKTETETEIFWTGRGGMSADCGGERGECE